MQPLTTSCRDHAGAHSARVHTWDGTKWMFTSEPYEADQKVIRPMITESAQKYAAEKKITPRPC